MGVKLAIIGAGGMAREHIKAFQSIGVEVTGIYSRTAPKAKALADEFAIKHVCSSIDELYEQTKADYVVVTVNVIDVANIIRQAAKYSWKILAEKPAGHNYAEAVALEKALGAKAADVFVALNRRSLSSLMNAKSGMEKAASRRIVEISDQQNIAAALAGGHPEEVVKYWMYANSIHSIDIMNYFCRGNVRQVTNLSKWHGADTDFVLAHVIYDSGDEAFYRCYFKQPGPWSAVVATEQARYEMRPLEKLQIQNAGERVLNEVPASEADLKFKPGFVVQAQNFVSGKGITLTEANRSMELAYKIYGV